MAEAKTRDDDIPLEELSDEQLEIEATDLRSDIEAITLDLLDDVKGGSWRSDDWRIRARAAMAYKRADLNVVNKLLKQRREAREAAEKEANARSKEADNERRRLISLAHEVCRQKNKAKPQVSPVTAEQMFAASQRTERARIVAEANAQQQRNKDRLFVKMFVKVYGGEACRALWGKVFEAHPELNEVLATAQPATADSEIKPAHTHAR